MKEKYKRFRFPTNAEIEAMPIDSQDQFLDDLDSKKPIPFPWSELKTKEFPEDRWIIKNLIPKNGFTILSSVSGEKKTFLAMEMARCIAVGDIFLGHEDFKSTKGNVLYVDGEMAASELQRRAIQLGWSDEILILNTDDLNLNDEEQATWIIELAKKNNISIIFLDTLRSIAGAMKENDADEVRKFFNRLKPLKNLGVSVVLLDHYKKVSKLDGNVPKKEWLIGSIDKTASVEVLLMLRSERNSEEIFVYQNKNRIAKEINPFKIIIRDEMLEEKVVTKLTYGGVIEEAEYQKERAKEYILNILLSGGLTRPVLLETIKKETNIGERNISDALRELELEGKLCKQKQGRRNFYTLPEGGDAQINQDHLNEAELF